MSNPQSAIETTGLRKEFGAKVAVEDLSLRVDPGEVFGFLGPNGAGKTTSVKMLLGLISPTAGKARILGAPLGDKSVRSRVGFLPEHFRFHDWLSAAEFLALHAELYHVPFAVRQKRIPELLDLVGLTDHAGKKLREYSKGMLQRIGLAQALLNQPDLIFLDEPTSGLDPVGRLHVREIIRGLRERGAAVFLNSHLLSEVEVTCDRVAFIKHGRVVQTHNLSASPDGDLSVAIRARPLTAEVISGLSRWGKQIQVDGEVVSCLIQRDTDIPEINRYLVERGVEVFALEPKHISLETLFVQIIGTEGGL